MVDVVFLKPGQCQPDLGDNQRWLTVDATHDGLFFGTGGSWKTTGEWVGYGSLSENDTSLDLALNAAREWADKYHVPTIWVQLTP